MRSSEAKGRLVKISIRRRRLAYSSFSRVARSAALPVNLAGSGNGQAPVTARSPKSGQVWTVQRVAERDDEIHPRRFRTGELVPRLAAQA